MEAFNEAGKVYGNDAYLRDHANSIRGNHMKLAAPFLAVALMLSACSKPTDAVIPSDKASWDEKLTPEVKKLSDPDREKIEAYLVRARRGEVFGGIPLGTTIGQAIDAQTEWENEQAVKRAEEENLKRKLEQVAAVTLIARHKVPKDYGLGRHGEYQEFLIKVQNNSEKPIVGVSGRIEFIDLFDKEVGSVYFKISESIAPGKSVAWSGRQDYNPSMDAHRGVWNLEEGKYTTRFTPEMVVFDDGTKLAVSNQ